MRGLWTGLLVSLAWSAPLLAQERDRFFERIDLALQRPSAFVLGVDPVESDLPARLGIFTLVPPTKRGEMIRVSIPIGELVTRAFRGVTSANQRRQETAARRKVDAALKQFTEQR
jgi:hypothetical protein